MTAYDIAVRLAHALAADQGCNNFDELVPRLEAAVVFDGLEAAAEAYTSFDKLLNRIWTERNIEEMAFGERGDGETKADRLSVSWPTVSRVLEIPFIGED